MSASKFKVPKKSNQNTKRRQKEMRRILKKIMAMKDEDEFRAALAELVELYPGAVEVEEVLSAWRVAQ